MTNNEFRILVNKYAVLIFIGYALTFLVSNVIDRLISDTINNEYLYSTLLKSLPLLIQFIINIIAAILISKDFKKLNVKNNLIVIITLLFSLIGITMFFIITNREMKNAST